MLCRCHSKLGKCVGCRSQLLLLFLFLLTACCMWHVAVASIRSRRCANNKLQMRSHHREVGQVPHRRGQARPAQSAAMSRAATALRLRRVASRGMQIRECLWVNIFGCARAADLTRFVGFGLGRQIKPVSNALSSLPHATCLMQQGCKAAMLHLQLFLSFRCTLCQQMAFCGQQLQLAMCDTLIDTSA